jgi:hypothetical protein
VVAGYGMTMTAREGQIRTIDEFRNRYFPTPEPAPVDRYTIAVHERKPSSGEVAQKALDKFAEELGRHRALAAEAETATRGSSSPVG